VRARPPLPTQYLRRIIRRLISSSRWIAPGLATGLLSLAIAGPALGAPSGDEYLPKVPKASGDESVATPSYQGTDTSAASSAPSQSGTSGAEETKQKEKKTKKSSKSEDRAVPVQAVSDQSSGGGSTLFDPVILLIVGGVICVAAGMIMRRRQTRSLQYRAKNRRQQLKSVRPTPEGEIVGSGEKPL
jgi:hypothetical protein